MALLSPLMTEDSVYKIVEATGATGHCEMLWHVRAQPLHGGEIALALVTFPICLWSEDRLDQHLHPPGSSVCLLE